MDISHIESYIAQTFAQTGDEHLPYEWGMLWRTHTILLTKAPPEGDHVIHNALIESFWLHAKVLAEYYRFDDPLLKKVNDQILTLSPRRTNVMCEKLVLSDRIAFLNRLCDYMESTEPIPVE